MPTIDPRLLLVFCLLFIGLAVFNLYQGIKRLREAQARGERLRWYKQLSILTGIEYILLALSFTGSLSLSNGWLPTSLRPIMLPSYLIMLFFAALLAAYVVYQNSRNARRAKALAAQATTQTAGTAEPRASHSAEEQERLLARRRERRQKAAAARRRRAGRA